ncbi:MAG: integrin alpha [Kofleriaceae bacterium]
MRASSLLPRPVFLALSLAAGCDFARTDDVVLTPPVLRAPARNAYLGSHRVPASLRPSFSWEAATLMTERALALRYRIELSTDPAFPVGGVVEDVDATTFMPAELAVSLQPPVGTRYYWRVRTCVGEACGEPSATWWINLARQPRDYNGDGFSDVVIGAPAATPAARTAAGRALLYSGGAAEVIAPARTFNGALTADALGTSVALLGDVNGDGFSDLALGAPGSSHVEVYLGAAGPPYLLSPSGIGAGSSVASAGDVNGDGFDDVIVGEPGGGGKAGHAYLYLGGAAFDTKVDATFTDDLPIGRFGSSVASAGDVNGDGYGDVIIGAPAEAVSGEPGTARVYFGGPEPLDVNADGVLVGQAANERCGTSVASAGDLNRDGFADVLVGCPAAGAGLRGRVDIYLGGPGAALDATADVRLDGQDSSSGFGAALDGAGDLNRDGFADFVVGAPSTSLATFPSIGQAFVFLGQVDGFSIQPLAGAAPMDTFGASVSAAGDVNGDGFKDLLVGAPGHDAGGAEAGRAYLMLGGPSVKPSTPHTIDGVTNELLGTVR